MNDEIKEILRDLEFASGIFDYTITPDRCTFLKDYITNLQQENEYLNNELNNMTDYARDLQQENDRLKELNAELKAITKRPTPIDYAMIQKRYDDYKSRCEKADNQLKIIMQIIKEQPTRNIEDDEWLENRLIAVANILQNGDNNEVNK